MLQHFRLDPLESNRRACSVSLLAEETIGTLIMVAWKPHLGAHQTRLFHGNEELQHFRLEPLEANREEHVQVLDILVLTKLDGSWRGRAATLQA